MAEWVATPGAAPAVVTETHVAVVAGGEDALAAIERVSTAPVPDGLASLVDLVLAGGPVAAAPAFFLAVREPAGWRAAVRGPMAVRVDEADPVLGTDAATWLEVSFAHGASFEVEVLVDGPPSWLPLGSGPARVGALRRSGGASPAASPVAAPSADPARPATTAVPATTSVPSTVPAPVDLGATLAQPVASPVEPGPEAEPEPVEIVEPEPAPAPPSSRYDDLFGEYTVAGGVAAAAVLEPTDGEGDGAHPAAGHDDGSGPAVDTDSGFDHSDVAVSAILCDQRHPNPPERSRCWKCSSPIASRSMIRVPRPSLGVLVLDDGREVPIDRTVLLGRSPRAERTDAANLPAVVSVGAEAAGVSRTHARIFLDGWQVLIEDLGSSFGTTIVAADGSTRRLRPGQPEVVNGDAVLDLGGGSRVRLVGVP